MVIVDLLAATICFAGACHPALVGQDTPTGTYSLSHRRVEDPGYDGSVLVFKENEKYLWAIHRVYLLNPGERRLERLQGGRADMRRYVTKGCINVAPEVYRQLVDCCARDVLVINKPRS
ncbi:murein L,D-transpeptidase [Noviherbaspirillum aerium]|uniref:murein L,D-transpeptidase n=1 Tax=Noviherbaspirillum aerium TaxID=2588497 RepID=UPI00124E36BA|nr:murein L,D-transpeptidase [Noviherbaspirillum aerium]